MYSKFSSHATCAIAFVFAVACSATVPWHDEPIGEKINVSFVLRNNLLYFASATIDGRPGRFLIGSAQPRTALDPKFIPQPGPHSLQLNQRESLRFAPVLIDLHGVADAIVGADVWGEHAITIDYRAGLLTFQRAGIYPELMTLYKYAEEPMIDIVVDGRTTRAIVDTTSPDTLILPHPGAAPERRNAKIQIAGTDFGSVDVRLADVALPRVGNRLLSKFLVSIDYGRRQIGLWRDPRTAL
jgi:hypothetical protein